MKKIKMTLEKLVSQLIKEGELVRLPGGLLALPWIRDLSWVKDNSFLGKRRPLRQEEFKTKELLMLLDPCFAVDGGKLTKYTDDVTETDFPTELNFYDDEAPSWYLPRINRVVGNYPAPILIGFIDLPDRELNENDLQLELRWLKSLNPQGPRVIYLRNYCSAEPEIPKGWNKLIAGIKKTFNPEEIIFGGGNFLLDYDHKREDVTVVDTGEGGSLKLIGQGALCLPIKQLQPHFKCYLDKRYCYEGGINYN